MFSLNLCEHVIFFFRAERFGPRGPATPSPFKCNERRKKKCKNLWSVKFNQIYNAILLWISESRHMHHLTLLGDANILPR